MNYTINTDSYLRLPEYCHTLTLDKVERKARPASASEVLDYLKEKGITISRTTLFNLRDRGALHVNSISQKVIKFDLNEIDDNWQLT